MVFTDRSLWCWRASAAILARVSAFRTEVVRAYMRENCIQPFIGEKFASAEAGALRVMTIGINAYLSEADWSRQNPEWFAGWFKEERHKFDRTVAEDASAIANALSARTTLFTGLGLCGVENIFHTNAVKEYLPESKGKRSDQVTRQDFERHVCTWHAELDIMAKHGVLPHVVIVFGRPFWEWAWKAFHPSSRPSFTHLKVHGFANASGEAHHFANLVDLEGAGGRQHLALLALRHPAARATSTATPEWLLSRPEVRKLLGFDPASP